MFEELGDVRLSLTAAQAVEARRLLGDPFVVAVHAEGWAHYIEDRGQAQQAFDAAGVPLHWPTPGRPVTLPAGRADATSPGGAGALARSFYAAVDARPFESGRVRAHLAEDFHDHDRPAGFGDDTSDRDVLVALLTALAAAFPDGPAHHRTARPGRYRRSTALLAVHRHPHRRPVSRRRGGRCPRGLRRHRPVHRRRRGVHRAAPRRDARTGW
nr:hypothetical protein [Streptomyces caniscabiei]